MPRFYHYGGCNYCFPETAKHGFLELGTAGNIPTTASTYSNMLPNTIPKSKQYG
jgi:hypothetical protein